MDREPLRSLMETAKDKKDTLLYFLKKDVREKVIQFDYEDKSFYINDRIFFSDNDFCNVFAFNFFEKVPAITL